MRKTIIFLSMLIFPINVFAHTDTAKSSIVMDSDSGRVIYEKNPDKKRLIASITKIMTAIIAIENGNLDRKIKVGDEVLKMYGTNIYVQVGEKIKMRDLIYGLLLRSGNDASVVIAKNVAGSEEKFVKMMNDKAKLIGMKNTKFENPHGLDEDTKNYSTVRDMAILANYAHKNKLYRKISSTRKYEISTGEKTYLWYNRNKLLGGYKYCTGGKNGYTPMAGKTLVTTASKNDLNLTIVTLDDNDSYSNHEAMYQKFFSEYSNYEIISKNNFILDKSFYDKDIYIKNSFYYPLTASEVDQVRTIVSIDSSVNAKKIGVINIYLGSKKIGLVDIFRK